MSILFFRREHTRSNAAGALVARAATKAHPLTPSGAATARAVDATAQEADEAPVTKAKAPVTYSRKKKNPATSEAAAAAATGTHYQTNLSMQATLLMKPLPPCVNITALHVAWY